MTAITENELRDKLMKKTVPIMQKSVKLIKQDTYEKKNRRNTIPEALTQTKDKTVKE